MKAANTQVRVNGQRGVMITWEAHLKAYEVYRSKYGNQQSAERIHERGGFGEYELDQLYPEWRNYIINSNTSNKHQ